MHENNNDRNSVVTDASSLLPSQNHYNKKVAVVTGSSSGIGYETALSLARNGFYTYATMHNLNKSKEIIENARNASLPLKVLDLDVASDESVSNSIANIYKECGRIDVIVNNAGYALVGGAERTVRNKLLWCYKGNQSCSSSDEKTEKRDNSECNIDGRKNSHPARSSLPCYKVCA